MEFYCPIEQIIFPMVLMNMLVKYDSVVGCLIDQQIEAQSKVSYSSVRLEQKISSCTSMKLVDLTRTFAVQQDAFYYYVAQAVH